MNSRSICISILLVLCLAYLISCSGDQEEAENNGSTQEPIVDDTSSQQTQIRPKFSLEAYLDSVSSEPERAAASFLKYSVMDGDYLASMEFLCNKNAEMIRSDSMMRYVLYGQENPAWDDLTRLKFSITRNYIPVLAGFNDIRLIERIECDDECFLKYDVTGPLLVRKLYNAALGENGKQQFDTYVDNDLTIEDKRAYYDYAFQRLRHVGDSLDYAKRLISDTLRVIKEDGQWKVCREAQTAFDIFRQK